jgi:hypothetical protein
MKTHEIHTMGKTNYSMRLAKATHVKFIFVVYQGWMIKQGISINLKFGVISNIDHLDENVKFDKTIDMYQNLEMDDIHVALKRLNMDEIGPKGETSCNKSKFYCTKTSILKMINITHKEKPCEDESTNQTFNALNLEAKKCVDVFMVAMDQMHIH